MESYIRVKCCKKLLMEELYILKMEKVYRNGQMELFMKEIGETVKHKETEYLNTQMVMFIQVSFIKIKRTVTVHTFILTDKSTRDIGKMIFSMVKE